MGAGGRFRDGQGTTHDTAGAERVTTKETETTAMTTSSRRQTTDNPPVSSKDNGALGKYRVGCKGTEESSDKSAK